MSIENPAQTLEARRIEAARASGGTSSDVIYERIIDVIQKYDLRGNALDYGAGIGNATLKLWDLGRFTELSGADILPRPPLLPEEIGWHCLDLNQKEAIAAGSFDAVISIEVIEHLENPREIAREWFRILKPGGRLVASTPNNESLRSLLTLIFRGHYASFADESYPAHITALLRKDIVRLLSEAGFSDISFEFTNSGCVPKLTRLNWRRVSFGLLKGCRFSDNIIFTATR